jgi:hypothetical protein
MLKYSFEFGSYKWHEVQDLSDGVVVHNGCLDPRQLSPIIPIPNIENTKMQKDLERHM